jgi:serine/threonine-protein kinase
MNQPADTIALDAVPMPSASAPQQIGDWLVQRRIGAGAMGEVFLAQRGSQRAALKLVAKRYAGDDSFTQRFQREIALLAKFDHPNVARALDGGEHEGRPWLAMEFVNGPDLDGLLTGHGPFFETDVLNLAMQMARGLEHIHQQAGLIHRDIKPANVLVARAPGGDPNRLLNPGDLAKLIDFGLAKPVEQDEGSGLTMTGMIMGTPNYIAPEQVACERHLTLHVDMYALGASMFHLLTGRVPFERGSAAAVMAAHLNDAVPDPGQLVPAISPATRKLVMTTLGKRASDRFTDWKAFLIACEKALAALGEGAPTTGKFLKKPMTRPPTTTARKAAETGSASGSRSTAKPVVALGNGPALEARPGSAAAVAESLGLGAPRTGADALRAAVTSRIVKVQTSSTHRKPTTRRQGNNVATSAVSKWSGRLETAGTTGGTILPWLVLGLAGALAIAGAVWALSA